MTSSAFRVLMLVSLMCATAACGKKGPPLPPLRPVPGAVSSLTAERMGLAVTLKFTVPANNLDGSTPPAVERIEIHAMTVPADAPAPTPDQLLAPTNRAATIAVRKPADPSGDPPPAGAPADPRPAAGDTVTHIDVEAASKDAGAGTAPAVRYFVATGLTGRRRGPLSAVLAVPLSIAPEAPTGLSAEYTEHELTMSWQPAGTAQRFLVEEVDPRDARAVRVTPEALVTAQFSVPVVFGRERCFAVRAVEGTATVVTIGAPTAPVCATPVDRFAPAAPTGLLAVASDGAIELVWNAVSAADLGGYVVLRAEGANGTLQRLTPVPIAATQFRDQSVRAGVTYAYVIVAVDVAAPPNSSEPSNRQVVTARQP